MNQFQMFHYSEEILSILRASSEMDSMLLITGKTGCGKSHLARISHESSKKRGMQKFAKINLAALSENLIESELFGHERGAFTGADSRRVGRLEACDGGTVFLDEIGELPLRLQTKLLDFIQYKKVSPVGSNKDVELDVRIVAATNKNLEESVRNGEFREDLYHRLNVFHVNLPGFSDQPDVIVPFARKLLQDKAVQFGKNVLGFMPAVEEALKRYEWPGNIRELEHVIEFCLAMEKTDWIKPTSLPLRFKAAATVEVTPEVSQSPATEVKFANELSPSAVSQINFPLTMDYHECRDAFEKAYLEQALRLFRGQINLTSRSIGLNKVSLMDKIKRYNIDWKTIRVECFGPGLRRGYKEPVSA